MKKLSRKSLKLGLYALLYGIPLLGHAAKTKKDAITHRQHEDHNPCACDKQCLACLFG